MNIFNSLGSNYSLGFAIRALFTPSKPVYSTQLKNYLSKKFRGQAILTYKGRHALNLALQSFKLPKKSLVAVNGFTCKAVEQGIVAAGFQPVYLPYDQSLNFSAHALLTALKTHPQIKAVIIQNTFNRNCDIHAIKAVCLKHHLYLIEDLAHSESSAPVADAVVLSFSQDKLIDAISGGAAVLRHRISVSGSIPAYRQLIDRFYPLFTYLIRLLYPIKLGKILHFVLKTFHFLPNPMDNFSARLPHWQARLALNQLKDLDLAHRQEISNIYQSGSPAYLRFPLFVNNRPALILFLKQHGVYISDIWYNQPMLPSALSETIINLPTHRYVSQKQAQQIKLWINEFGKK